MANFSKQRVSTCIKFARAFSYSLPIKINNNIVQYLGSFGKQAWSFKNTNLLKLNGPKFQIDAIGDTHVLTITMKKDTTQQDVDRLETLLDSYIDSERSN
jgi:hypothetical protein